MKKYINEIKDNQILLLNRILCGLTILIDLIIIICSFLPYIEGQNYYKYHGGNIIFVLLLFLPVIVSILHWFSDRLIYPAVIGLIISVIWSVHISLPKAMA